MTAVELCRFLYIDADSPTGLRWRTAPAKHIAMGSPTGTGLSGDGYYRVRVQGNLIQAHRVVAVLAGIIEDTCSQVQIDHIDGVRTNNPPCNLRAVTNRQNATNRLRHRAGRLAGVTRRNNKWQARIRIDGKQLNLGCFDTEEAAHLAYKSYYLHNQVGLIHHSK